MKYKIAFIGKPSSRWIDAAVNSHIMPDVVDKLVNGSTNEIVNDAQLDAVCEWDKTVSKQSSVGCQIDFWPSSDCESK